VGDDKALVGEEFVELTKERVGSWVDAFQDRTMRVAHFRQQGARLPPYLYLVFHLALHLHLHALLWLPFCRDAYPPGKVKMNR
jgi:hypothetical protein